MKETTQGFTLIELLAVIAIIGTLASVLIIGLRNVNERVNITVARQCAQALLTKAAEHASEYNTYEGFTGLGNQRPDSGCTPTQRVKTIRFEVTETTDQWIAGNVHIDSHPAITIPWTLSGIGNPIK